MKKISFRAKRENKLVSFRAKRENKLVYFDHAATTPLDPEVFAAMGPFLRQNFGNPSSLHRWGQETRQAVEAAREKVVDFLGCQPREVIFTSGATEANNLTLKGVIEAVGRCQICRVCQDKKEIPHLIISQIEHHSVLDTAQHLEKLGYKVTYLPVDKDGLVSVDDLKKAIQENTVLVSVMYGNNEIGTVEPIPEIGAALKKINEERVNKKQKIYFHTDAVQAIQYLNCQVDYLGVDLLSLTAHKFYGPKGVGALYLRKGTPIMRQMDGGGQEHYLRAGTENVAGIVGMGKAIENFQFSNIQKLRDRLIEGVLKRVPGVILTGHPTKRLPHIASFCVKNAEGEALILALDQEGIAVSSGSACTSGILEPSHVLSACGIPPEISHGSLRLSLGKDNTHQEVDYFLDIFPKIVERLRKMSPIK